MAMRFRRSSAANNVRTKNFLCLSQFRNGSIVGISYRDVIQKLRVFGFQFDRQGPGSHEIWRQAQTGRKVTIPHHSGDMAEGTLRAILREAAVNVNEFLKA